MNEGISLRLSTKVWGGNWLGAQLRRCSMNTPGHGNEEADDDNDDKLLELNKVRSQESQIEVKALRYYRY